MYNDDYYLHQLKKGSLSALDVLFRRYRDDLLRFAFYLAKDPEMAEDIVQDVFVNLWENRRNLASRKSLKPYLIRIVSNGYMDLCRKGKIREKFCTHYRQNFDGVSYENTESKVRFNELNTQVQSVLEELSPQQRKVFVKIKLEGMRHREVAEEMGVSIKTVEGHLTLAQRKMRSELKDYALKLAMSMLLIS
ncbi:DNA-directed RNA polymerase sigma-70 factor [Fulvitalea axinellae]|uniref:DNA-directed RNA polymerase sigma-70 factor n=1 Tax=Fulvitalea axinellae TaxID=1182444 RepID=A0AAU9C8P0_9BACT|nr:DNA-directed RNA polymerase sigma-70 factor [Fulvitalea axinellae]